MIALYIYLTCKIMGDEDDAIVQLRDGTFEIIPIDVD
jgi:hypothetical protein